MHSIGKLIDTFRYGSAKTRRFLLILALLTVASVACSVLALTQNSWTMVGAAFVLWVALFIVAGSKELSERKVELGEKGKKEEKKKEKGSLFSAVKGIFKPKDGKIPKDDSPEGEKMRKLREAGHIAFTDKELAGLLKLHHVKRTHKTILIDNCATHGIKETPAYVWRDKRRVYFLLLLASPKRIQYPIEQCSNMTYKRAVLADEKKDYLEIVRPGPVNIVFGGFLPLYYRERLANKLVTRKNLYCLGKDIYITAASVKNVVEVINPRFEIEDEITESHNEWFNECYRYNTLWRDKVYKGDEYKNAVVECLKRMCRANIPFDDFRKCLEGLVEYHIITDEMADKFAEYRRKYQKEQ